MGQHSFCQHLAQLNAFLVKTVQVPQEALEHYLVFKMRKQSAECFRCQAVPDNDAGRAVACKLLVQVLIILAAGKGHDLSGNIGTQFLLTGTALYHYIHTGLIVDKADKLKRDNICSLMQQLIEGMLSVCSGFAEDNRTGRICQRFSPSVDTFPVRLHIKLLQMGRKTAQCL